MVIYEFYKSRRVKSEFILVILLYLLNQCPMYVFWPCESLEKKPKCDYVYF